MSAFTILHPLAFAQRYRSLVGISKLLPVLKSIESSRRNGSKMSGKHIVAPNRTINALPKMCLFNLHSLSFYDSQLTFVGGPLHYSRKDEFNAMFKLLIGVQNDVQRERERLD